MTTTASHTHLHLIRLPFNRRWCFTMTGTDIIPMLDQRTFESPDEAARALEPLGMALKGRCVITVNPDPFDRD